LKRALSLYAPDSADVAPAYAISLDNPAGALLAMHEVWVLTRSSV